MGPLDLKVAMHKKPCREKKKGCNNHVKETETSYKNKSPRVTPPFETLDSVGSAVARLRNIHDKSVEQLFGRSRSGKNLRLASGSDSGSSA